MKTKVLVIGADGRADALARQASLGIHFSHLYALPGNPGTKRWATTISGSITDFVAIEKECLKHGITTIVVGPEDPLVKGISEYFAASQSSAHIKIVGPSAKNAKIEGSKAHAKQFMDRHGIPTAPFQIFKEDQLELAKLYIEQLTVFPTVIKADGLAAGKGVLICHTPEEALAAVEGMLSGAKFGDAGKTIVVEEFLPGKESSFIVITDGTGAWKLLPLARDYKRAGVGDTGLNTGGMGVISTPSLVTESFKQIVTERVIEPTIQGFIADGTPYKGFLYIQLMEVEGQPFVVEYNCRLGDPETEGILPLIKSDFSELLAACANGTLKYTNLEFHEECSAVIAIVSGGYPGDFEKDKKIMINKYAIGRIGCNIFFAGAKEEHGELVTSGGRVLYLQANAPTLKEALNRCYEAAKHVFFDNMYFRTDIGAEVLALEAIGQEA
ncbi:MAG: phosphoribosylamine--glycine ligase [Patescibacteria group bacterium]|nr:phosphoribosylamine--glycine ligase [Patescibacteria group bacterium]